MGQGWGNGEVEEWQHFLRLFILGKTRVSSLSCQLLFPNGISSYQHDQASPSDSGVGWEIMNKTCSLTPKPHGGMCSAYFGEATVLNLIPSLSVFQEEHKAGPSPSNKQLCDLELATSLLWASGYRPFTYTR